MGTTKTALQAGSLSYQWVLAIEGYQNLLTDGPTAAAVTAWAGTDFAAALPGLFVSLENSQKLNPWDPFTGGGTLTLHVAPDSADTFGIDTHKKTAGAETMLNATADRDDTTITVLSTTGFAASGTAYVGTEAFSYSGVTATTFTGCTRGKCSPFGTYTAPTVTQFGEQHTVGLDPNFVKLQPLVTSQPRVWIGKWVGLWMHRTTTGVLDVKAQAQLVFAGRIVEIRDDPSTMCTVVEVEHVLDYIKRAVLGRDMFTAKIADGVYVAADPIGFFIQDAQGATLKTSNALVVVPSGAAGVNQMNAGVYTIDQLVVKFNDWAASELTAGRIFGTYSFAIESGTDGTRTALHWTIGGGLIVSFGFLVSDDIAKMLGYTNAPVGSFNGNSGRIIRDIKPAGGGSEIMYSDAVPLRFMMNAHNHNPLPQFDLVEERGTFVDQNGSIPSFPTQAIGTWGLFLFDGSHVVIGRKNGTLITNIIGSVVSYAGADHGIGFFSDLKRDVTDTSGPMEVKQIFVYESKRGVILQQIFLSTGTAAYNHASLDVLAQPLGIGIPGSVLGDNFINSCSALPGALDAFTLIIDEPTKLADVLSGELLFCWAFLRWMDQGIQFHTWKTPTTGVTLSESNKAGAAGNIEDHRTVSILTDEWERNVIKVDFDRDISEVTKDGGYRSSLTLMDRTSVDDAGGDAKPFTIKLRNTYGVQSVEAQRQNFMTTAPMFTRPYRYSSRSMDSRFWEGLTIGDCVLVTDAFARDPDTGRRGVTTRPGIVISHRWSPGGAAPNGAKPTDMSGEVAIMFQDLLRVGPYVPCADLDDTSTNSGYVVATKVLTCYAHRYSETSEGADASYFKTPVGQKVRIVERDPSNPAAPVTWDDTVASQTGNTITLTTGDGGLFDPTKKYRVVWDDYTDAIAAQQAYSYQADDVDGQISNLRAPYQYIVGGLFIIGGFAYTVNAAADPVELVPSNSFGDGVGRDVGHDAALNRLINNLIDFKTAHSSPWVQGTLLSGAGATGTYKLVEMRPINLTADTINAAVARSLSVSVHLASSDGTSASVRVTLARNQPLQNTVNDVDRGATYGEATFTTTSTTYATPAAVDIPIGQIKDWDGNVWILVECTVKARCYGVSRCQEGPRV